MPDLTGALKMYCTAVDFMREEGFEPEITWQRCACPDTISEATFLREAAWVVLCSGFRESVVRRVFDYISLCYCDWESAAAIVKAGPTCVLTARVAFGHVAKLNALVEIARRTEQIGFDVLKADILHKPTETLGQFPFIGPVTVSHLAKNLGFDIAKPDRHLVRIAEKFGYEHPDTFCSAIAKAKGESVKVVDLIVWRYLASISNYKNGMITPTDPATHHTGQP